MLDECYFISFDYNSKWKWYGYKLSPSSYICYIYLLFKEYTILIFIFFRNKVISKYDLAYYNKQVKIHLP